MFGMGLLRGTVVIVTALASRGHGFDTREAHCTFITENRRVELRVNQQHSQAPREEVFTMQSKTVRLLRKLDTIEENELYNVLLYLVTS